MSNLQNFIDLIQGIQASSLDSFIQQKEHFNVEGRFIQLDPKKRYIILGDLHGDYDSFKYLVETCRIYELIKKQDAIVVFLGDYIDRGPKQLELILVILRLFISFPRNIILLRGNHEGPIDLPCHPNTFKSILGNTLNQASEIIIKRFQTIFDNMYTGAVIRNNALLLHGGIPTQAESLDEIITAHKQHPKKSYLEEILWNDPMDSVGYVNSARGAGKYFGPDITQAFLSHINVDSLIRGHQSCPSGFKIDHGRIITLFSCKLRNYRNNSGAILLTNGNNSFKVDSLVNSIMTF